MEALALHPRTYYVEDRLAKLAFLGCILASLYVAIWIFTYPELGMVGLINLALLFIGKTMYPKTDYGTLTDDPLATVSRGRFFLAALAATAGVFIAQNVVFAASAIALSTTDPNALIISLYAAGAAAVSESYCFHWGIQSWLALIHPWLGVLITPAIATAIHFFRYGESPVALIAVAASFGVLCYAYQWSGRLSVPITAHLIVNVTPYLIIIWSVIMFGIL